MCKDLLPPLSMEADSVNYRKQKSKISAVCSFGACPIQKTISLSVMPWHHQPPITIEKVQQVLSVKPPAATVKSQRVAPVWGGVFLLPCFCIKLEKKLRSRWKPFLWKTKNKNFKSPRYKPQTIQECTCTPPPPSSTSTSARLTMEAFVPPSGQGIFPVIPAKERVRVLGKFSLSMYVFKQGSKTEKGVGKKRKRLVDSDIS